MGYYDPEIVHGIGDQPLTCGPNGRVEHGRLTHCGKYIWPFRSAYLGIREGFVQGKDGGEEPVAGTVSAPGFLDGRTHRRLLPPVTCPDCKRDRKGE